MAPGQRLLGFVQHGVQFVARRGLLLLVGTNHCHPSLVYDQQRSLEATSQRGRARGEFDRLPARRQLRVVDRCTGRELLGFEHQRLGCGERGSGLLPLRYLSPGLLQPRQRWFVFAAGRLGAQRVPLFA